MSILCDTPWHTSAATERCFVIICLCLYLVPFAGGVLGREDMKGEGWEGEWDWGANVQSTMNQKEV